MFSSRMGIGLLIRIDEAADRARRRLFGHVCTEMKTDRPNRTDVIACAVRLGIPLIKKGGPPTLADEPLSEPVSVRDKEVADEVDRVWVLAKLHRDRQVLQATGLQDTCSAVFREIVSRGLEALREIDEQTQITTGRLDIDERRYHGRECKRCGSNIRYKSNNNCEQCAKATYEKWRARPEVRERERERDRNRSKQKAVYHKEWLNKNPEKRAEYSMRSSLRDKPEHLKEVYGLVLQAKREIRRIRKEENQ